jgi:hypothetical protein
MNIKQAELFFSSLAALVIIIVFTLLSLVFIFTYDMCKSEQIQDQNISININGVSYQNGEYSIIYVDQNNLIQRITFDSCKIGLYDSVQVTNYHDHGNFVGWYNSREYTIKSLQLTNETLIKIGVFQ